MKRWLPVILCIVALTCVGNASVVYDNLGSSSNGADPVTSFGPLADSFSTGGAGFTLASVGLKLELLGAPTGTLSVDLLADNNTSPGGVIYNIGTIDDNMLSGTLQDYFLNLTTAQVLTANTRYWIELSSMDSNAGWSWSGDQNAVGVAGEYFANLNGVFDNSNGPYQMRLSDTAATPEPGTLVLLGGGICALTATLRRKLAR